MQQVKKHSFEPVSLLTVENGVLELAVIPASNQPNWLIPKTLILAIDEYEEHIWTYLWQGQEVSVYPLSRRDQAVNKLVVLEGNTDVHRLALQISGEVTYKSVRISDVKDAVLSDQAANELTSAVRGVGSDFVYQAVSIDGVIYVVPELDLISHRLVDLDS